jgi:hypothetical protein
MHKSLADIRSFMEQMGIPGRDLWELPPSTVAFPDGAHWRVEISGVERPSTMEAMIDEARRRQVPVHRAIATVGGSTFLDFHELQAMAQMAWDAKVEVIMAVGHRKAWDVGSKEMSNWEGAMWGARLRGSDNMSYWIADMMRNIEAGFRGFLVYDEGLLSVLARMRDTGFVPRETVFKCSVFAGHCSPAGARLVESIGANTFNPSSDVSLPILAAIRRTVRVPIDVYVSAVDSMGGEFRVMEAPEIVRVAAPCYLKIEPGKSEPDIYKPWVFDDWHERFVREKVKMAEIFREVIGKHAPSLKLSDWGPDDLVLPRPE